jgi:hypothetical protein
MALFIRQQDQQSELQKKIAAELQDKARAKAKESELPDGVYDSAFLKGTKQTSRSAWVWIVGVFFAMAAVIMIIINSL